MALEPNETDLKPRRPLRDAPPFTCKASRVFRRGFPTCTIRGRTPGADFAPSLPRAPSAASRTSRDGRPENLMVPWRNGRAPSGEAPRAPSRTARSRKRRRGVLPRPEHRPFLPRPSSRVPSSWHLPVRRGGLGWQGERWRGLTRKVGEAAWPWRRTRSSISRCETVSMVRERSAAMAVGREYRRASRRQPLAPRSPAQRSPERPDPRSA